MRKFTSGAQKLRRLHKANTHVMIRLINDTNSHIVKILGTFGISSRSHCWCRRPVVPLHVCLLCSLLSSCAPEVTEKNFQKQKIQLRAIFPGYLSLPSVPFCYLHSKCYLDPALPVLSSEPLLKSQLLFFAFLVFLLQDRVLESTEISIAPNIQVARNRCLVNYSLLLVPFRSPTSFRYILSSSIRFTNSASLLAPINYKLAAYLLIYV